MNSREVWGRGGQSNLVSLDLIFKKNWGESDRAMRAFSIADNQCALYTPTASLHHSIHAQRGKFNCCRITKLTNCLSFVSRLTLLLTPHQHNS